MGYGSTGAKVLLWLVIIFALLMVIGQVFGQPVLFGFVSTGSMSPALDAGDGFVAVPPAIHGDISQGDVITFDASELEGGGLTTHRVVGETDEGYLTQGDANPFRDQDSDEPPVRDVQIVAVALQFDGEVVRIPQLGTFALAMESMFMAILGAFAAVPGVSWILNAGPGTVLIFFGAFVLAMSAAVDSVGDRAVRRRRERVREDVWRASIVLGVMLLLVLVPATLGMVIPSGVEETTIISSTSPTDNPLVIAVGGNQTFTYEASRAGIVPRLIVLEPASTGVVVEHRVMRPPREGTAVTNVTISAPGETGRYERSVSERHYTAVIPAALILAMHDIHPHVAILGINLVLGLFITVVFVALVGFGPIRLRSRSRGLPAAERLRRLLR